MKIAAAWLAKPYLVVMAVGLHNIIKASWWDHIITMRQHVACSAKLFSKCYSTVRIQLLSQDWESWRVQ